MDAPEEDLDIKLQKISGDFIDAVDKALPALLRKGDGDGGTRPRSMVRWRDLAKVTSLVRLSLVVWTEEHTVPR